jgi:hypothetical protein
MYLFFKDENTHHLNIKTSTVSQIAIHYRQTNKKSFKKISSGGILLIKGNLMLDLSTRLLFAKRLSIFLGKVFGGPRFP